MVMGAEIDTTMDFVQIAFALFGAVLTLVLILFMSSSLVQIIGQQGLNILPKITGLFVSAIASQIVFSGIQGFLF